MCDSLLPKSLMSSFGKKELFSPFVTTTPTIIVRHPPPPPITLHNAPLELVLASLNRDHCWVELHYGTRTSAMCLFLESLETLSLISLLLRMQCLKLGQNWSPTTIGFVRLCSKKKHNMLAMLVYF